MADSLLKERLQSFIENEGKSCSFDLELITPEYVYGMWGGAVAIEEISSGLKELQKNGYKDLCIYIRFVWGTCRIVGRRKNGLFEELRRKKANIWN